MFRHMFTVYSLSLVRLYSLTSSLCREKLVFIRIFRRVSSLLVSLRHFPPLPNLCVNSNTPKSPPLLSVCFYLGSYVSDHSLTTISLGSYTSPIWGGFLCTKVSPSKSCYNFLPVIQRLLFLSRLRHTNVSSQSSHTLTLYPSS